MRVTARCVCFVAVAAGAGAACSAFGSNSDDDVAPAPADAGVTEEAARDAGPSDEDAREAGGPITLLEDHFETGATLCDGWDMHGASTQRLAEAGIGGSTACRMCTTVSGGGNVSRTIPAVAARGNYTLVAQVSKEASASGTQWTARLLPRRRRVADLHAVAMSPPGCDTRVVVVGRCE